MAIHALAIGLALSLQQPVVPPSTAQTSNPPRETVALEDIKGFRSRGKLLALNAQEAVLLVDGQEQRFALRDVRRIDKRGDSLKNGAIIGGVIGLLGGLGTLALSDCGSPSDDRCPGGRAAGFVGVVGVYTLIGVGIDAATVGHTPIYLRPAVMSLGSRRGGGLQLSVRW